MKKFLFGVFVLFCASIWYIYAQSVIMPDSAEIDIDDTIIQWQATNMSITMMKAWSKMSAYTWEILMKITDEKGWFLNSNEYVLPNRWTYQFESENLWFVEFQRWLEIKKEGRYYVEISDYNDEDDKVLWRKLVNVIKWGGWFWEHHIDILSPGQNEILTSEKLEIIWQVSQLPNSTISIYIDNQLVSETSSDGWGNIYQPIPNIEQWNHTLRLECYDAIEWKILWSSDNITFSYVLQNVEWFRWISVDPENNLQVWDFVKVTVNTDEIIETVKMDLSDRAENDSILMDKEWNWLFTTRFFLVSPGEISIDVTLSYNNASESKFYGDVKRIYVWWAPEIGEVRTDIDEENQNAKVSWNVINGSGEIVNESVSWYIVNYRIDGDSNFSWEKWTENNYFVFSNVPYDREISMNVTPYREGQKKHGAASKTVQFIITKPQVSGENGWETIDMGIVPNVPKCTVQNISLRTTKIGDSYYLMWDKVENVSKYIVYSSQDESWRGKTKVYETSDTSYEYPFDHTAESEQFLYFWIVWICDDGEELQLSWATKVQVWPAENFFLLLCMTLLIYFWIKMFKETEV